MTYPDARDEAIALIGKSAGADYRIEPSRHADELGERVPGLAAILNRGEIQNLAGEYEKHDRKAINFQAQFIGLASRANIAVFLAAFFGVLVLVASMLLSGDQWEDARRIVVGVLGTGGVIAGALAAMWLQRIEGRSLLRRWMEERAEAETLRLNYFDQVATAQPDPHHEDSEPPLALLQLEYFVRYHFDVQRNFYEIRADDHARRADRIVSMESGAVLLSSIGIGLGSLGAISNPQWAPITAVGVVGSALASLAATRESIGQHRRNAERYGRVRKALNKVGEELDRVRQAASEKKTEPVAQFVEAVNNELSLEHRQWLEDIEGANKAVQRLRTSLEKIERQRES